MSCWDDVPDSQGQFCHGGQLMGKITSSQIIKTQLDRRTPEIHLWFSLYILCITICWQFLQTAAHAQGRYLLAALAYLLWGEQQSKSKLPSWKWSIRSAGKNQNKLKFCLKTMRRCSDTTYIQTSFSLIFWGVTGPVKKQAVGGSAGYMLIFMDFCSFLNQGFSCSYCDWHVHCRKTKDVFVK